MAEVKNSFLKSKMNKDLDARLLPNGEYRDALNVSISKSENANVGALENVEGNSLVVDVAKVLGTLSSVNDLKIIGQYTDKKNKIIYLFLTNYTGGGITYDKTAVNWICSFNLQSLELLVYSTGAFLNFSTRNTILSVNLLESIIYWTDDRNQPRKLNVENSLNVNQYPTFKPFYLNEDQISVAKIAPYLAIDLYKENGLINETTLINATSLALPQQYQAQAATLVSEGNTFGYSDFSGQLISVIEGYYVWSSDGQLGETEGVTVTNVDGALNQITISKNVIFSLGYEPILYFASPNPKYNELYPGDSTFLEDRFARFSYRYKFLDGEFSIMAPFTQICFIPKQYGFFLADDEKSTFESTIVDFMQNQVNQILLQLKLPGKSNELLSSFLIEEIEILYKESQGTSVSVVDTISAKQLINNGADTTYQYDYQSTEPFKTLPEVQTTRVYDKTPVKAFCQEIISNRIVYSNYQNKHTPPANLDYNVGVGDKFGNTSLQSNKSYIAYPNHTLKQNRTYQVGVVLADKYGRQSTVILSRNQNALNDLGNTSFGGDTFYSSYRSNSTSETSVLNWPGDSIKVLFNSVIQSNKSLATTSGGGQPGLYNSDASSEKYNPTGWYSYKIVVKQTEQEYYNVYLPGILNGYPAESTQFDANNQQGSIATVTLFSDNINKVPRDLSEVGPDQRQFRSSVRMWGRVSPQILGTNTSFPTTTPEYNQQYYPSLISDTVSSISTQKDMFSDIAVNLFPFEDIYESESNPILGRISTVKNIGSTGAVIVSPALYPFFLAVYETEPTTSRIDIYWETSTSGLISELNELIETSIPGTPSDFSQLGWNLKEDRDNAVTPSVGQGPYITDAFWPVDIFNSPVIDTSISNFEVRGIGGDAAIADPRFALETIPIGISDPVNGLFYSQVAYRIKINSNFVFLQDSTTPDFTGLDDFEITAVVSNNDPSLTSPLVNTLFESESLANATPNFGNPDAGDPPPVDEYIWPYNSFGSSLIPATSTAVFSPAQNGSALEGSKQEGLRWSITAQQFGVIIADVLVIDNITGVITIATGAIASGQYDLVITLSDASGFGLQETYSSVFIFGEIPVNCQFNQSSDESDGVEFNSGTNQGFINTRQENNYPSQDLQGNSGLIFWSSTVNMGNTGDVVENWNINFPPSFQPVASPASPVPVGQLVTTESTFGFTTKSINLGNGPKWCNDGNAGLTKGTGYIIVTLRIINMTPVYLGGVDFYSQSLIALQARKPGLDWQTVSDIENTPCDFTGKWRTRIFAEGDTSDGGNLQQGSLVATTPGQVPSDLMLGVINSAIPTPTINIPAICVSRAFAIPSGTGGLDLRLCIDKLLTNQLVNNASPAQTSVSVSYGDFYYPNQQNNIAYSYRINNIGQANSLAAKNISSPSFEQVYAREPLMKYVTKFYTDVSLTTVYVGNSSLGNWFLYQPGTEPAPNSYLPIQINESFPDNSALLNGNSLIQSNRRYVAQFDVNGLKQGLSQPRELGN